MLQKLLMRASLPPLDVQGEATGEVEDDLELLLLALAA